MQYIRMALNICDHKDSLCCQFFFHFYFELHKEEFFLMSNTRKFSIIKMFYNFSTHFSIYNVRRTWWLSVHAKWDLKRAIWKIWKWNISFTSFNNRSIKELKIVKNCWNGFSQLESHSTFLEGALTSKKHLFVLPVLLLWIIKA